MGLLYTPSPPFRMKVTSGAQIGDFRDRAFGLEGLLYIVHA